MISKYLNILFALTLLSLMVGCHPEAFYSFNYNTKGAATTNLFGIYTFDGTNGAVLVEKGFTNGTGSIELKSDMTFVCSNIPSIMGLSKPGEYFSFSGKWRTVNNGRMWEVEFYDIDSRTAGGFVIHTLPIIRETPPHGLELAINHDEGYYIRYERSLPPRY